MSNPRKKILFAAGGTGGHLFPAQALAEQLQKDPLQPEILFAGAGLSRNSWFAKERFAFRDIVSKTPFGGGVRKMLSSIWTLVKGTFASLHLLSEEKPDLIVGFGSFHTFPILLAAVLKGVPFVLFESNAIPGKVVRLFSGRALWSGIYFSEAKRYLKGKTIEVEIPTEGRPGSSPLSKEEACQQLHFSSQVPVVLVFGGSQGAKGINRKVLEILPLFKETPIQLIHMTGCAKTAREVLHLCQQLHIRCCVKTFEPNMELAWKAADVVICRSGAMTLSELLHHAVPGILIPFPNAADQHQLKNAQWLEEQVGGTLHFQEATLTAQQLADALSSLISPFKRAQMKEAIIRFKTEQKKVLLSKLVIDEVS